VLPLSERRRLELLTVAHSNQTPGLFVQYYSYLRAGLWRANCGRRFWWWHGASFKCTYIYSCSALSQAMQLAAGHLKYYSKFRNPHCSVQNKEIELNKALQFGEANPALPLVYRTSRCHRHSTRDASAASALLLCSGRIHAASSRWPEAEQEGRNAKSPTSRQSLPHQS
jgi:hypothetical protein